MNHIDRNHEQNRLMAQTLADGAAAARQASVAFQRAADASVKMLDAIRHMRTLPDRGLPKGKP